MTCILYFRRKALPSKCRQCRARVSRYCHQMMRMMAGTYLLLQHVLYLYVYSSRAHSSCNATGSDQSNEGLTTTVLSNPSSEEMTVCALTGLHLFDDIKLYRLCQILTKMKRIQLIQVNRCTIFLSKR